MERTPQPVWVWIAALVLIGLACGCVGLAAGGLVGFLIGVERGTLALTPTPTPAVSTGTPWLGVRVSQEADGARILEVFPNSPAERAGLRPGDRIVAFDGEPVNEARPLTEHVRRHRPGDTVRLTVIREGEERTVSVTLGRAP